MPLNSPSVRWTIPAHSLADRGAYALSTQVSLSRPLAGPRSVCRQRRFQQLSPFFARPLCGDRTERCERSRRPLRKGRLHRHDQPPTKRLWPGSTQVFRRWHQHAGSEGCFRQEQPSSRSSSTMQSRAVGTAQGRSHRTPRYRRAFLVDLGIARGQDFAASERLDRVGLVFSDRPHRSRILPLDHASGV